MGWIEYWDDKPTIYVSQRHREAHYRSIADGICSLLGEDRPVVLDYGCGEALSAAQVAHRCGQLHLCDAAPSVRLDLARRFSGEPRVSVVAPEGLDAIADGSVDLIVANSVIQYVAADNFDHVLELWLRLLAPNGLLIIADVIPRSVGPLTDAAALLSFAWRDGFLAAALGGLARTFFSDYRRVRAQLGLRQLDEQEMLALLGAKGLVAERTYPNLGHNQSRMAFKAHRRGCQRTQGDDQTS